MDKLGVFRVIQTSNLCVLIPSDLRLLQKILLVKTGRKLAAGIQYSNVRR